MRALPTERVGTEGESWDMQIGPMASQHLVAPPSSHPRRTHHSSLLPLSVFTGTTSRQTSMPLLAAGTGRRSARIDAPHTLDMNTGALNEPTNGKGNEIG